MQILQSYYQPNIVLLGFGQICDVMREKKHTSKNVLRYTIIFLKTRGQLGWKWRQLKCIHVDKSYFFFEIPIHSFALAYQLVALRMYECWCLLLNQKLLRLWCGLQRSLLTRSNSSGRWTWTYNAWGGKKDNRYQL